MSDSGPPLIIDVTSDTFTEAVIERSFARPVVVDFWAEWCGPCKTLGPVLETLVGEYAGRFVLARAETEALPEIAARFGVRSIPAVFGVRDGKVVDSFVGAQPESTIRAWLDRLMPTPAEAALAEARGLEPTDPAAAETRYRDALELGTEDPAARIGLARVLMQTGQSGEAGALIEGLEKRGYLEPDAEAVKAGLSVHAQAASTGGVASSRDRLAADPADPALRLKLAEALAASGGYEEALGLALTLVEDRPGGLGDEPRRLMLNVFQLLPPDSELASEYRRRLSAALY